MRRKLPTDFGTDQMSDTSEIVEWRRRKNSVPGESPRKAEIGRKGGTRGGTET